MRVAKSHRSVPGALIAFVIALLCAGKPAQGQEDYYRLDIGGRSREIYELLHRQKKYGPSNIVFMISPMVCPRCEGIALDIMRRLRGAGFEGAAICVLSYPRLQSVREYSRRRQFPLPTLIDTSGNIFREIGLGDAPPFVTVWDSTGKLKYAKAIYGVSSQDTVMWRNMLGNDINSTLSETHSVAGKAPEAASTVGLKAPVFTWKHPRIGHSIVLQEDSAHTLGKVSNLAVNPSRSAIALTDNLTLSVKVFAITNGRQLFELAPEARVRKYFSPDLTDSQFFTYERAGISSSMFFGPFFISDDTILVSASLPRFWYEKIDGADTNIGYMNVATIVSYKLPEGQLCRLQRLHGPENLPLVADHAGLVPVFNPERREVVARVSKGYPLVGTSSAEATGEHDPRRRSFYDDAPLFWRFGLDDGKLRGAIGSLDTLNYLLGIGYALSAPLIAFDGDRYSVVQQLIPWADDGAGERITLKSYFNPAIVATSSPASELPSVEAIKYLADSSGARFGRIDRAGDDLLIACRIKRSGSRLADDYYVVVQRYSISHRVLLDEWLIPRTGLHGMLADISIDASSLEAWCVYQNSLQTSVVSYSLH